jgi:hypothetical protein
MTPPLQPEPVAILYEFLRSLPPFSTMKRKLPHADDVEFRIVKDCTCYAFWRWTGHHHSISVSSVSVGQTITLVDALGHEMCHIAVWEMDGDTGGNENTHNAVFRKLATRFCKIHGLDLKAFY